MTAIYHQRVSGDGTLTLRDLPPGAEVEVIVRPVIPRESPRRTLEQLRADLKAHHPLFKLTDEELDEHLRRTRETVANETYPDLS